jgi:hypothetical protein
MERWVAENGKGRLSLLPGTRLKSNIWQGSPGFHVSAIYALPEQWHFPLTGNNTEG